MFRSENCLDVEDFQQEKVFSKEVETQDQTQDESGLGEAIEFDVEQVVSQVHDSSYSPTAVRRRHPSFVNPSIDRSALLDSSTATSRDSDFSVTEKLRKEDSGQDECAFPPCFSLSFVASEENKSRDKITSLEESSVEVDSLNADELLQPVVADLLDTSGDVMLKPNIRETVAYSEEKADETLQDAFFPPENSEETIELKLHERAVSHLQELEKNPDARSLGCTEPTLVATEEVELNNEEEPSPTLGQLSGKNS